MTPVIPSWSRPYASCACFQSPRYSLPGIISAGYLKNMAVFKIQRFVSATCDDDRVWGWPGKSVGYEYRSRFGILASF
jgi:hypothetical protein